MNSSLTSRSCNTTPLMAGAQQCTGSGFALSLRQYSPVCVLFQRMSKLITQLDAPLSTTHSSGRTASFTGESAAAAGRPRSSAAAAANPVISVRMGLEGPGKAAEESEDVIVLHQRALGN